MWVIGLIWLRIGIIGEPLCFENLIRYTYRKETFRKA
jgi:hypothetical protein